MYERRKKGSPEFELARLRALVGEYEIEVLLYLWQNLSTKEILAVAAVRPVVRYIH